MIDYMSNYNKDEEAQNYDRYLFKKKLDTLKEKKGFHTALITLTIPPSKKVHDVIGYLEKEISESSNIKDKNNRKNVLSSIRSLIERLRLYKEFPENGLVMFAGQIPEEGRPGTEKSELYDLEPPEEIQTFRYYCSSEFYIKPLYDMIEEKGTYGIINVENKEAAIGWVRGAHLEIAKTMTSGIHSKHNAGGQSQRRLERLIEEGAQNFYKRIGEYANNIFLDIEDLRGIFISGAGMSKEKFAKKGVLDYRLDEKILDFVDVSYSGEEGIRETVIKIQDKIEDLKYVREKKLYKKFMDAIVKENGLATYGEKEVKYALEIGAVDTLLYSDKIDKLRVTSKCSKCGYETTKTIDARELEDYQDKISDENCPECQSSNFEYIGQKDLLKEMGEMAKNQGSKIEILSTETEEGMALYKTWGGIAANLRFRYN